MLIGIPPPTNPCPTHFKYPMKPSKLSITLFAAGIALVISLVASFYVSARDALETVYSLYFSVEDTVFGPVQLGLLVSLAVGFALLCALKPIKHAFVYWSFFAVIYIGLSLVSASSFDISLFPFTVLVTTFIVGVATHLTKLWYIDATLTRRLLGLVNTGNVLSDSAEMRVETSLTLLESIFPVSEVIVFRLEDSGILSPIGRARKENGKDSGVKRNATWRETVKQCEQSLSERKTVERISEFEENAASLAVPLDTGDEIVGVLYIDVKRNYEDGDKVLLEAFARQLARNFQRKQLKSKSLPHSKWWSSFSSQSSENRLFVTDLIAGILHEKSFGTLATSKLEQAHAVAYLDGTLAFSKSEDG